MVRPILALIAVALLLSSCTDCGPWVTHKDGSYGPWWWHDESRVTARYARPSDDAPEALKPFYDPDLTGRLNQ